MKDENVEESLSREEIRSMVESGQESDIKVRLVPAAD